jgi:hypothetical protein
MKQNWKPIIFCAFLVIGVPIHLLAKDGGLLPRWFAEGYRNLALLLLTLSVASVVGNRLLAFFFKQITGDEALQLFALPLGLGVLSYAFLALAVVGLFKPWIIFGVLLIFWMTHLRAWWDFIDRISIHKTRALWGQTQPASRVLLVLVAVIYALKTMHAFAPPVSYDALMYHLVAPNEILDAGKMITFPQNWPANGPLTIQMLFTIGLVFQSGSFARLLHLSLGFILLYSLYYAGKVLHSHGVGLFAALILVGIPIFPSWASWAYADMGWALFELLAFFALIRWSQNHEKAWMMLSGLCCGLAAGSKYLGLSAVGIGTIFVLFGFRREGLKVTVLSTLQYAVLALGVASPWYLKNLVLLGNPIYPFLLGGDGWNPARVDLLVRYHQSFGTGRTLLDFILLPYNMYAQHGRFSTFGGSIEIPSLLFPIALLYPLKRDRRMDAVGILAILRIIVWAAGSQQIRHLLPAFPLLSLLTAYTLFQANGKILERGWRWIAGMVLTGGMVATSLTYAVITMMVYKPLPVVLGMESESSFLGRNVQDSPAIDYANSHLPPDSKVFMLWDARTFYCGDRCLPDDDHSQWSRLVQESEDVLEIARGIKARGAEYILFSLSDVDFHLQHDPTKIHQHALDFFLEDFRPKCTALRYQDDWASLYQITCLP